MKKRDFVEKLSKQLNKSKKETNAIVDEFSDLITNILKQGGEVGLNIGKFSLREKPSRLAMNPSTGEKIVVDAKVVPLFKPSSKLKNAVLKEA